MGMAKRRLGAAGLSRFQDCAGLEPVEGAPRLGRQGWKRLRHRGRSFQDCAGLSRRKALAPGGGKVGSGCGIGDSASRTAPGWSRRRRSFVAAAQYTAYSIGDAVSRIAPGWSR